jgi:hypothetical protein
MSGSNTFPHVAPNATLPCGHPVGKELSSGTHAYLEVVCDHGHRWKWTDSFGWDLEKPLQKTASVKPRQQRRSKWRPATDPELPPTEILNHPDVAPKPTPRSRPMPERTGGFGVWRLPERATLPCGHPVLTQRGDANQLAAECNQHHLWGYNETHGWVGGEKR